jgi:glutaredoxin
MGEEEKESEQENPATSPIKKSNLTEKIRENPWIVSTFILGILVVILFIAIFSGNLTGNVVSKEKAADNLMNYLNTVANSPITLVSVENLGGLYLATIKYQNQDIPVYLTKDGNYYTTTLIPINSEVSSNQEVKIPKTEKPNVELYVMSFCPYGNEAEKTMQPVYDLLKDKVNWSVHFIVNVNGDTVNSLHGPTEVTEDEREACVIKNYGIETWFKFANYVNNNCGSNGSCWQDAAKVANVDVNIINSCVTSSGLVLMKAEAAASDAAGVTGSPTLIINGVESNAVYRYGNSEAYKGAICEAFKDVPTQCSIKLSSTSTAASGSC